LVCHHGYIKLANVICWLFQLALCPKLFLDRIFIKNIQIMHVVIIGNGVSGITCARNLRKLSDHKITVISEESEYFFSRTALMYVYMGHMPWEDIQPYESSFWKKNRIELKKAKVEAINPDNNSITFEDGSYMNFDHLVLATGSKSNKFGWPGQELKGVSGLYHKQDLDMMESHSKGLKHAVIVGGGLIGIEMAEMFHSRHIPVTILVRESAYWSNILPLDEAKMVSAHVIQHGIDLRHEMELSSINGSHGTVESVTLSDGSIISCQYVGLTVGVSPNIDFVKSCGIETNKGIQVNDLLQTNFSNIYAIGDCAELRECKPGRRNIEAIWYTGRMMGELAAHNIMGKHVKYDPGLWFNSAKFLDIEYQVYGDMPAKLPEEIYSLFYKVENQDKSIRINYDSITGSVTGFNLMGIRYRHEICEYWIKNNTSIETVLQQLSLANFDPEFSDEYEKGIISEYNLKHQASLKLTNKRSLNQVHQILNQA